MPRGTDSLALFITVNEQSESNQDCIFHSFIASFVSGRSYHQNLFVNSMNPDEAPHGIQTVIMFQIMFQQKDKGLKGSVLGL